MLSSFGEEMQDLIVTLFKRDRSRGAAKDITKAVRVYMRPKPSALHARFLFLTSGTKLNANSSQITEQR